MYYPPVLFVTLQNLLLSISKLTENVPLLADYPTIMGFEPLVNQRLLPPTFPRYTMIKSRKEALYYMEHQLLRRLQTVTFITEITSLHNMLVSFKSFPYSFKWCDSKIEFRYVFHDSIKKTC